MKIKEYPLFRPIRFYVFNMARIQFDDNLLSVMFKSLGEFQRYLFLHNVAVLRERGIIAYCPKRKKKKKNDSVRGVV